jgi:hypothetical protein
VDKSLTKRERPQLFIDTEKRRVQEGAASIVGKGILDDKTPHVTSHIENMAW